MLQRMNYRRWLLGCVLALGLLGGLGATTSEARADHYASTCTQSYVDIWVTVYQRQVQTYRVCVTRYDHCGKPYRVYETRSRIVKVPIRKRIRIYR